MPKWFVEVVKNPSGKYHANMMIDGRVVEGLLKDVDYNTLRSDIRAKTGLEILPKSHMWFGTYMGTECAYLDYTRDRLEHRVSIGEVVNGRNSWRPDFDGMADFVGKQVVIGPHYWKAGGFEDIAFDVGTVVRHVPATIGELCEWSGSFCVQKTDRFYLDGRHEALDDVNEFSDQLQVYSAKAQDSALRMLEARFSFQPSLK